MPRNTNRLVSKWSNLSDDFINDEVDTKKFRTDNSKWQSTTSEIKIPSMDGSPHYRVSMILPSWRVQIIFNIQEDVFVGRYYEDAKMPVDLDMTPYNGLDLGVSRNHCIIKINTPDFGLLIIDQNSSNGTKLNGERLIPMQGYLLKNKDEILLGMLKINLEFFLVS